MAAGAYNFTIEQNTTLQFTMTVRAADGTTPVNLTGYTIKGEIRQTPLSALTVAFTCTITDAANGVVSISLTATQTALLVSEFYLYDIIGTKAGVVTRYLNGKITVAPGITQPAA